jgi:hypothetical protein
MASLSSYFVVKDPIEIETFLGCKILNNKSREKNYIHQPTLNSNLKEEFGALVESLKEYQTPAPQRSMVKRPNKEDTSIQFEQHTKFRSRVDMLT